MTSLVTLEDAETYASARPSAAAWTVASTTDKGNALLFASTLIRSLPYSVAFSAIEEKEQVQAAVCEWAIDILRNPDSLNSAGTAVAEKEVGDLRVKYRVSGHDYVPPMVRVWLAPYIAPAASGTIIPR